MSKRRGYRLRLMFVGTLLLQLAITQRRGEAQVAQPSDVVRKLYREVVLHHPLGVPHGAAKTAIWPLISRRLVNAFQVRNACDADWDRQHQNSDVSLKAPGFYEDGLFSGSDEEGHIDGFVIGRTAMRKDGSYLVSVKIWSYMDFGESSLRAGSVHRWRVAARVILEDGHFVVDDILGFKGAFDRDKDVNMSKMLTTGCRGAHSTYD